MGRNSFQKSDRVVRQIDFDRVHQSELFAADKTLVIKAVTNANEFSRLGLSISKRVGNAVVRNRWKRRIREAFRQNRKRLPVGWDFVIRPRKGAQLDFNKIEQSLLTLTQRIAKYDRRRKRS